MALFLDKKFVERKLEVMQTTYEHCKDLARVFAGPACIEMFGEEPFVPEVKEEVLTLNEKQQELSVSFDSRQSQLVNTYIPGDERSFTIIAYPVPEIGDKYEEIFDGFFHHTLKTEYITDIYAFLFRRSFPVFTKPIR